MKHKITGASQKTMPEAQIPIIIMTPNKSSMSIEKAKIKQHPAWEPYAFPELDFALTKEQEQKSEYAKFRQWLIEKVSETTDNFF